MICRADTVVRCMENDKMNILLTQIMEPQAAAFTHGGKFHADDVFSAALLRYLNPDITIERGNRVPDDYKGIVFDIGRGRYDHHQRDSRIRENGVPYAAFGLLWEELGVEILGEDLTLRFDEDFVQPLDLNDNTGEKNELATLIGQFNPVWDDHRGSDEGFFRAVSVAEMILKNKFDRYLGKARADQQTEAILAEHDKAVHSGDAAPEDARILVLPDFVPCQKRLEETDIAFIVFPSNRGGYCIQPLKKKQSMNYKCSFPEEWLGLENEELAAASGLQSATFCHKGGFLMSVGDLEDAVKACRISLLQYKDQPVIVRLGEDSGADGLLLQIPGMEHAQVVWMPLFSAPELEMQGNYGEIAMEKPQWKQLVKEYVREILHFHPEAVFVNGELLEVYPVVHALRKKHVPVLTVLKQNGGSVIVRIPAGS